MRARVLRLSSMPAPVESSATGPDERVARGFPAKTAASFAGLGFCDLCVRVCQIMLCDLCVFVCLGLFSDLLCESDLCARMR
jgi:hypothetical protein